IEVKHTRSNAHRLQGAETSNAQQQFLPDPNPAVAAIETGREIPVLRRVSDNIGVEKKQIAPSDFQPPDSRPDRTASRFRLHHYRPAVCSDRQLHRQLIHIGLEILFLLPAVAIEPLPEVTLAIKQADAD